MWIMENALGDEGTRNRPNCWPLPDIFPDKLENIVMFSMGPFVRCLSDGQELADKAE